MRIALALTIALTVSPAIAGGISAQDDRQVLGSLIAAPYYCKIDTRLNQKWVRTALGLISSRRGWSIDQMGAIGQQQAARIWGVTNRKVIARFCNSVRALRISHQNIGGK